MSQQPLPGQFEPGKLLDFFRFFDPTRPQHVEGVKRLERALAEKEPELLNDHAYWVTGWRTPPKPKPPGLGPVSVANKVRPLAQVYSDSCGQTSVAMAINALAGRNDWTDERVRVRYGFGLLRALNAETGWVYEDAGNIGAGQWADIEACLRAGGVPIAAGNGPNFSLSGHGHIMCIVALSGDRVTVADPNGNANPDGSGRGFFREVTRKQWEQAPQHPQGNFLFLCQK